MEIHIVTAFPKIFDGPLNESIVKRAVNKNLVTFYLHDFRAYCTDKHKKIDDYPYGGGPGMILKPEPIYRCIEDVRDKYNLHRTPVTLLSPAGTVYTQKSAVELSLREKLILLCGHYKGLDERVIEQIVDEEISIGDYILTGGELAALVVIDSVVRLLPGAIGDIDSAVTDSFQTGLLDHPHYTRPEEFRNAKVPEVLLSGNHQKIEQWRADMALQRTKMRRIDLYNKFIQEDWNDSDRDEE